MKGDETITNNEYIHTVRKSLNIVLRADNTRFRMNFYFFVIYKYTANNKGIKLRLALKALPNLFFSTCLLDSWHYYDPSKCQRRHHPQFHCE